MEPQFFTPSDCLMHSLSLPPSTISSGLISTPVLNNALPLFHSRPLYQEKGDADVLLSVTNFLSDLIELTDIIGLTCKGCFSNG